MITNNVIIGRNIRRFREEHELSIDELAEMLRLSSAFIGLIERGKRGAKLDNLLKLAKIFDVDINDLLRQVDVTTYAVAESKDASQDKKRKTLIALTYDLDEKELDFIISSVKSLKKVRAQKKKKSKVVKISED